MTDGMASLVPSEDSSDDADELHASEKPS
jgi:hypothetical protein